MALPKSGRGLGPPVNLLSGAKKRSCISSLHPSQIFQAALSPALPALLRLCVYWWLCWLSLLFQETQPGWALLVSSPLSLVKVTFLQTPTVRQHLCEMEGRGQQALASVTGRTQLGLR